MINPHDQEAPPLDQPLHRIRAFAKDLAFGALIRLWNAEVPEPGTGFKNFEDFVDKKWNGQYPSYELLVSFGYLNRFTKHNQSRYSLTKASFDLLDAPAPDQKVFISYKRSEDSSFALAMQYKLSELGITAFLDRELEIGEEWHSKLEEVIKQSDYFIVILSPTTLESESIKKEIRWAYEENRLCLPIWNKGFRNDNIRRVSDIDEDVRDYIGDKNAFIMDGEESASKYHNAISMITNKLGLT